MHGVMVQVQERFRSAYQEVKTTMAQLYSFFQADSEEVQREWLKFTQKVLVNSFDYVGITFTCV